MTKELAGRHHPQVALSGEGARGASATKLLSPARRATDRFVIEARIKRANNQSKLRGMIDNGRTALLD